MNDFIYKMKACDYKEIIEYDDDHLKIDWMAWIHADYGKSGGSLIVTLMNNKMNKGG